MQVQQQTALQDLKILFLSSRFSGILTFSLSLFYTDVRHGVRSHSPLSSAGGDLLPFLFNAHCFFQMKGGMTFLIELVAWSQQWRYFSETVIMWTCICFSSHISTYQNFETKQLYLCPRIIHSRKIGGREIGSKFA